MEIKVDLTKYIEENAFNFDLHLMKLLQIYLQTLRTMIEAEFHKTKIASFEYGQTDLGITFTMIRIKKQN